ncbi:MAG TPA: GNAT family N-acetyltransferase [Candidatus Nanopelagicales bacterium]|nr:GNAT family N-acetyltransferase [Candidatus Nanopelagicales bacterium]
MTEPVRPAPPVPVRDARDEDGEQLIALIGGVFAEYPGCVLDVDGEMPELRAIATAFRLRGGRFWVAEEGGRVLGCVGVRTVGEGTGVELCKLYVAKEARRRGLGGALSALVEAEARARGAASVELWTDTRFTDAHRLYERRGYVRGPATRELHDRSATVEYFYRLSLGPGGHGRA